MYTNQTNKVITTFNNSLPEILDLIHYLNNNINKIEIDFYEYKNLGYSIHDIQLLSASLQLIKMDYNIPKIKEILLKIELKKQGYSEYQIDSSKKYKIFYKNTLKEVLNQFVKKKFDNAIKLLKFLADEFQDYYAIYLLSLTYLLKKDYRNAFKYACKYKNLKNNNYLKNNEINEIINKCMKFYNQN